MEDTLGRLLCSALVGALFSAAVWGRAGMDPVSRNGGEVVTLDLHPAFWLIPVGGIAFLGLCTYGALQSDDQKHVAPFFVVLMLLGVGGMWDLVFMRFLLTPTRLIPSSRWRRDRPSLELSRVVRVTYHEAYREFRLVGPDGTRYRVSDLLRGSAVFRQRLLDLVPIARLSPEANAALRPHG